MHKDEISKYERIAIYSNFIFVFLMGLSGLVFGILAHSSAVTLDGLFSTVLFITVVIASVVGIVASKPRNRMYPQGHWLLENLYVLFKLLILMAILIYSFIEGVTGLVHYYMGDLEIVKVDENMINIYYVVKATLAIISFSIYTYYIKKVKNKSEILSVERKSVVIDGVITLSIALGFLIFSNFEQTKLISDFIILTLLSLFLFITCYKDFKKELGEVIGKRVHLKDEQYYKNYFNLYFHKFHVSDVYIHYVGKVGVVAVTASFEGKKDIDEIKRIEKSIKKIMEQEFGEIFLYTYWDNSN